MKKVVTLLIFIFLNSFLLVADQEQSTYAYVSTSQNGRYYFKMLPAPKKYYSHNQGTGIMYYAARSGKDKELWRVSGWYAFKTFVSFRGEYLVRMGNWPRGFKPNHKDLAIAFYKKGKLIKKYSTKDLVKRFKWGYRSVGHYRYFKKIIGFNSWGHKFTLITIDNIKYVFNAKTGKIISAKQL